MKERILTSLITVIVLTGLQAQTASPVPRLVVGLTIDQLRSDYIEAFSALYGEKGFKRLMKEGRVYCNAEYDFINIDRSSAVASVYTGTTPYYNGIVGNRWMDRNTLRMVKCVDDPAYMGIYTSESTSPQHLLVSTLSDELMVASNGAAEVYSIAPTREMAILSAGHAAKCALWLNDETGKWCGSTYYGTFPDWVTTYNDQEGLDFRIGSLTWGPYLPVTSYRYVTSTAKQLTFKHDFSDERLEKYRKFKTSPYVNDEVNRLVDACLLHTQVGKDNIPDLLTLSYYAGNYAHKPNTEYAMEIQDMYVRLDHSIGELLELIDRRVGLANTLFFIQIYLNHKLIEDRKLNLTEILNCASDFIVQMSGVRTAYSSQRLLLGAWTPRIDKIRNTFNPNCSGDIYVEVMPGWSVIDEVSHSTHVVRDTYASVPLIFIGNNIKPEILYTPVKVATIAPTVAHFMRIRAPNAAMSAPLTGIRK